MQLIVYNILLLLAGLHILRSRFAFLIAHKKQSGVFHYALVHVCTHKQFLAFS